MGLSGLSPTNGANSVASGGIFVVIVSRRVLERYASKLDVVVVECWRVVLDGGLEINLRARTKQFGEPTAGTVSEPRS